MFWQQLINGITLGSTYALIALGYTMVYGIISLINFAHGEIYMIGAFIGLLLVTKFNLNIILAMLLSMLACMGVGIIMEKIAYKPLRRSSRLAALISAIGVSIFLSTFVLLMRGPQTTRFPQLFEFKMYSLGKIAEISNIQVLIILVSTFLMITLQYIVKNTKIGKAMRATSQDYDTASLMGVNVDQIISYTFALGSALASAGGILVGVYFNAVFPLMGVMTGMKAFAAAVLGGIGSIPGAVLGALLLGNVEVFTSAVGLSSYKDAVAFGILILVLLIKPTGLMGRELQRKV